MTAMRDNRVGGHVYEGFLRIDLPVGAKRRAQLNVPQDLTRKEARKLAAEMTAWAECVGEDAPA